jgi:hypothetical protein
VLNANIDTGGGTDDTAALQAVLDTAISSGPLELVLDGVALISRPLVVHSHTTIRALPGAGVFMQHDSPSHILTSDMNGSRYTNTDISIIGGTWNGNEMGQAEKSEADHTRTYFWKAGFWFSWVNGLTIKDVTVRNAKTYSLVLSNVEKVEIDNYKALWDRGGSHLVAQDQVNKYLAGFQGTPDTPPGGNNWDGIHFFGNVDNVHVNGFTYNGDDDGVAFNTNEMVETSIPGRGAIGDGAINNVTVENVVFDGSTSGVRFIGNTTLPGNTVDSIVLHNVSGSLVGHEMLFDGVSAGHITIDGWHVTGPFNAINLQNPGSGSVARVTLSDIDPTAALRLFGNTTKEGSHFSTH